MVKRETKSDAEIPLIVVAGPTASGKTALALRLAEEFDGEIVSCDSVAVYREMEIGTAKPTPEERAAVVDERTGVREDLSIARPTHALTPLRAVGWNAHEIRSLPPQNIAP